MFGRFRFLNPFPLVDDDLELVAPAEQYVDALLATLRHPLTEQMEPDAAAIPRMQILDFLLANPAGQHRADHSVPDDAPSYHFWMLWRNTPARPCVAGGLTLRIGQTTDIERHLGHIGYNVYAPCRGHRFAARATRLVLPLARQHKLKTVWITCNPDNLASRLTIERVGATYVDTIALPFDHSLRERGETQKMRFRIDL